MTVAGPEHQDEISYPEGLQVLVLLCGRTHYINCGIVKRHSLQDSEPGYLGLLPVASLEGQITTTSML